MSKTINIGIDPSTKNVGYAIISKNDINKLANIEIKSSSKLVSLSNKLFNYSIELQKLQADILAIFKNDKECKDWLVNVAIEKPNGVYNNSNTTATLNLYAGLVIQAINELRLLAPHFVKWDVKIIDSKEWMNLINIDPNWKKELNSKEISIANARHEFTTSFYSTHKDQTPKISDKLDNDNIADAFNMAILFNKVQDIHTKKHNIKELKKCRLMIKRAIESNKKYTYWTKKLNKLTK